MEVGVRRCMTTQTRGRRRRRRVCSCRGELEGKSVRDNRRRGGGGGDKEGVRGWSEDAETSTGRRKSLLCAMGSGTAAGAVIRRVDTAAAAATAGTEDATSGKARGDIVDDESDASRCRLEVVALRGSVPPVWKHMFAENIEDVRTSVRRHCGDRISDSLTPKTLVNVKYKEQLKDIVDELQAGATGARPQKALSFASDMVTLGDVWLQPTIANGLIQPLRGAKSSAWWKKLPYEFRELVLRDTNGLYDPDGEVYGCPYNWGATVIAVRTDKANSALGGPVNDWKDLYNMALRGKVGMVASTREVVGSVLKGSGVSYNASASRIRATAFGDNERGRTIRDTLDALGGQVRLYTSKPSEGLKALSAGDLWAFVGWSSDLIQYARRSPNIALVAPVSGTSLWADVMTMPTGCPNPRIARPFFDEWCKMMVDPIFCVPSKGIAGGACVSMLTRSTSDVFTTTRTGTGRVANRHHERVPTSPALGTVLENKIVDERTLRKSEFLYPLDAETIGLYRTLLL